MLARVWRKGIPLILFVGMQTDITTMENSMEIPLKTRNKTIIQPSNPTTGHIPWGNQNWKRHIYSMFIAALFTIAKTWKQTRCPVTDECIRKLWLHIHSGILPSYEKEHIWVSSNEEPRAYYTDWSSQKDKYHILMHIHGIKKVLMILLAGQQRIHRRSGHSRWRRGWDDMRESPWNTYITIWLNT